MAQKQAGKSSSHGGENQAELEPISGCLTVGVTVGCGSGPFLYIGSGGAGWPSGNAR